MDALIILVYNSLVMLPALPDVPMIETVVIFNYTDNFGNNDFYFFKINFKSILFI